MSSEERMEPSEDDSEQVLYAYEEEAPRPKTKEELIAERFAALKKEAYKEQVHPESDPSGAAAYLDACRGIDAESFMIFPTESIAKELAKDKETLDLAHACLGEKGCTALAAALRVNSTITKLVLIGNHIRPAGGLMIAQALREGRSVTSLDLSVNHLGDVSMLNDGSAPPRGGNVIQEIVGVGSVVQSLAVRSNNLTDSDVALFTDTLSENTVLQHLDLSYNKIGYSGATLLGQMLGRNGDLREVNFEWNNFRNVGCEKLLSEGVLNNNTLKTINLSACGLDDGCASLVGRVISENAIEEVIVANNRIGAPGADAIAKGLQATSSLQILVLDGNPLGDKGARAILNVIASEGARTLQILSLQQCECNSETEALGREISTGDTKIIVSEARSKVTP